MSAWLSRIRLRSSARPSRRDPTGVADARWSAACSAARGCPSPRKRGRASQRRSAWNSPRSPPPHSTAPTPTRGSFSCRRAGEVDHVRGRPENVPERFVLADETSATTPDRMPLVSGDSFRTPSFRNSKHKSPWQIIDDFGRDVAARTGPTGGRDCRPVRKAALRHTLQVTNA